MGCLLPRPQVRPKGREAFGTKVEIKNMNNFSNMQKAIDFEFERQARGREGVCRSPWQGQKAAARQGHPCEGDWAWARLHRPRGLELIASTQCS